MDNFKPMLAGKVKDTAKLRYPLVASPKLDGIRAVNPNGDTLLSRTLKAIPNFHVQKRFGHDALRYFDGELICGDPRDKDVYNKTYRAVMAKDGKPDVKLYTFDHFQFWGEAFFDRLGKLPDELPPSVVVLEQKIINSEAELLAYEEHLLAEGYEGVMVRDITGRYKFGRSTDTEGLLLKLKRFADDDCQIIGFEELMSNQNEATTNELGRTKRSTHQENLVPMDTLGALIVKDVTTGVVFNIGTGFTAEQRQQMWNDRQYLIGQFAKYKHFKVGVVEKPRFPVFLGMRDTIDMGAPK